MPFMYEEWAEVDAAAECGRFWTWHTACRGTVNIGIGWTSAEPPSILRRPHGANPACTAKSAHKLPDTQTRPHTWENGNPFINLKCDPDYALELRADYDNIMPGYHSNKKHWNSIYLKDNNMSPKFLAELITHSYVLVVKGLPKKVKVAFGL